jgi:hypothetical protein
VDGYRFDYLRLTPEGAPVAGGFPGWPRSARELKILDPCLGSGHLLVLALPILAAFRRVEEGLDRAQALEAVVRDNLHGLELDPICCRLAVLNLSLAVWKRTGYRPLPLLQVACCGLPPRASRKGWVSSGPSRGSREALDRLYSLFSKAPLLGSLLNPAKAVPRFPELLPFLEAAEKGGGGPGMAARLLGVSFHLVLTNVPYLTRGKQCPELQTYCDNHHPAAKSDLADAFLERMGDLAAPGGAVQVVMPQNWLFLKAHRPFRQRLLTLDRWLLLARLGPGAFGSITGEVVNVMLFTLSPGAPPPAHAFRALDVSRPPTPEDKALALIQDAPMPLPQLEQLEQPDARIQFTPNPGTPLLSSLAQGIHGFGSKDSPRFFRKFWELPELTPDWQLMETTVQTTEPFGGTEQIVRWEQGQGLLAHLGRKGLALPAGRLAWGHKGVSVSQMGGLPATLHLGAIFDKNVAVILPRDPAHLPAIWSLCSSPAFFEAVREVDPSLKVTNNTLVKIPFDLAFWQREAAVRYPRGLPAPASDDPTQWLFHGHPVPSTHPLHVAMARLLGYVWPAEQDPALELSPESRQWIRRCSALAQAVEARAILPLTEAPGRLRELLRAAYGPDWSEAREEALLRTEGFGGQSLEAWLREGFGAQHGRLFQQRPWIWHVGDAHPGGFSALVNYHRLDHAGLESLIRDHLEPWLRGPGKVPGARRAQALELRMNLKRILRGEPPLDLFVRWKPLEQQPRGWEPDLNDGVRVNIRPFILAGVLVHGPKIHWRPDRGRDSAEVPRYLPLGGERTNDLHLTLEQKRPLAP